MGVEGGRGWGAGPLGRDEPLSLVSLPRESFETILSSLSLVEACRLSLTCRGLYAQIQSLWWELALQWQARQPPDAFCDARDLERMTSHTLSARGIAVAMHRLGAWPAGLWLAQGTRSQAEATRLVAINWTTAGFRVSNITPERAQGVRGSGRAWVANLSFAGWMVAQLGTYAVSLDDRKVCTWHWETEDAHNPELSQVDPGGFRLTMFERFPWSDERADFDYGNALRKVTLARVNTIPVPPESLLPAGADIPPGLKLLAEVQGLVTGEYATHGTEVLSLSLGTGDDTGSMPLAGLRLEALKLIGDPNVPGGRLSFVVDPFAWRPGHEGGVPDWDDLQLEDNPRPIMAFMEEGHAVPVELSLRPIRARFLAHGQVNHIRGIWMPEWVPATLLLYHQDDARWPARPSLRGGRRPLLSAIFSDEDQAFRQIIDYYPVPTALYRPATAARSALADMQTWYRL